MLKFDQTQLEEGMILHARTYGVLGKLIRKLLKSWGNHDGLFVFRHNRWWVGDAAPMVARLTPIEIYESGVDAGEYEIEIYDVVNARPADRKKAGDYWTSHVLGTFYDFLAYPRLFLKILFGDRFKRAAGWEWAHWCTEGVANSWDVGAGCLVWQKSNPTPLTTEKRVGSTLEAVTDIVFKTEEKKK